MASSTRSSPFALVALFAAGMLAGCDRAEQPAAGPAATQSAATRSASGSGGSGARDRCPTEAEIAAVIGSPVKRLKGAGCSYQSEDEKTDVSILIMGAGSGEQLLGELKESAAGSPNAKVEPVAGIGDSAHMYAVPGRATAVAVGGGKSYWVEVSSVGGDSKVDRQPQVIQILRLLMR